MVVCNLKHKATSLDFYYHPKVFHKYWNTVTSGQHIKVNNAWIDIYYIHDSKYESEEYQLNYITCNLCNFYTYCDAYDISQNPILNTYLAWWRHQMETFSAPLAFCAWNSRSPVNSPHKGQWRGALMFSLICAWINGWVNNREAGDFRRHRAHYDVIVMLSNWRDG